MKNSFQKIIVILGLLSVICVPVHAQLNTSVFMPNTETAVGRAGYDNNPYQDPLPIIIGRVIKTILTFVGIILLSIIIYGGFLWMTAGGKSEQVGKAIDYLKNGAIGVLIIIIAYSITTTVIYIALEGAYGWRWWPFS